MEEGKLFKQLRQARGFTLAQLSDTQNSRSFISKFESGASNITLHRLAHLLEKINVSFEEFLYLRGLSQGKADFSNLLQTPMYLTSSFIEQLDRILAINKDVYSSNETLQRGLKQMTALKEEIAATHGNGFILLYVDFMTHIFQINLEEENTQVRTDQFFETYRLRTRPVVSYLLKVDDWGVYEVLLFRYFQFLFPVETSHRLLKTAISRTKKETGLAVMREVQLDLLFGTFSTFINFRHFEWAKEVLAIAEEVLFNRGDLLNSTNLLCYQGWYWYILGDTEKGMQKFEQGLSVLRILKQPELVNVWEKMVKIIKKNAIDSSKYMVFR
ncbi:helix-turn-helix domain-containing protein [Enterococcus sp. DIV0876]|uniref:helix-turn-helix domain-containing protein n=1 Tax=Enterococcus sp. DIV0876 TaxID=2774633 RepID=UPI003D2FEB2E